MESFVALTRFQAGRPRFKGEERQRELVWRQMVVCFPWQQQRGESLVSASPPVDRWSTARRWAAPSSQEPELPARLREETGGLWGSYRPGRAPLRATHPDTLQRYRLVSCWGLSGLEAAARACLAQSESKFKHGEERSGSSEAAEPMTYRGNFVDSRDTTTNSNHDPTTLPPCKTSWKLTANFR